MTLPGHNQLNPFRVRPQIQALQVMAASGFLFRELARHGEISQGGAKLQAMTAGLSAYQRHCIQPGTDRNAARNQEILKIGCSVLRAHSENDRTARPILLLPALNRGPEIFDLTETDSLAGHLAGAGVAVYLLDWGHPSAAERDFDLTDYLNQRLVPMVTTLEARHGTAPVIIGHGMAGLLALELIAEQPGLAAAVVLLAPPLGGRKIAEDGAMEALWQQSHLPVTAAMIKAFGWFSNDAQRGLAAMARPEIALQRFTDFGNLDPASAAAERFAALEDWRLDGRALSAAVARRWMTQVLNWGLAWPLDRRQARTLEIPPPLLLVSPQNDRLLAPLADLPSAWTEADCELMMVPGSATSMLVGERSKADLWRPLRHWLKQL